jgi:predicted transcriptional regulator
VVTLTPLILDFLEWLAVKPRPYSEVMDAWRTSCPRFTIWEDVIDEGFVVRRTDAGNELLIELTPRGRSFLQGSGRVPLTRGHRL